MNVRVGRDRRHLVPGLHEERLERRRSVAAVGAAGVGGVMAVAALVALLVEAATGPDDAVALLATAVVGGAIAAGFGLRYRLPRVVRTTSMLVGVVVSGLLAAALAMLPYLVSGELPLDAAIFEGVAGITTTNATTLSDPGELGHGLLLWRAATQWIGAAAVVLLVVVVLPELGIGGLDPGGVATRSARRVAPRAAAAVRRLGAVYLVLTVLTGLGYAAVGMPIFESWIHALTTASTGGFSSRPDSLAGFDSAGVELVAIASMIVAGTSLPLLWRLLRRREIGAFSRSVELRLYVLVLVVVSAAHWLGSGTGAGVLVSLRRSVFASASAVTTTGFELEPLTSVGAGSAALLMISMGVGAMAASVSGGFKLVRVMAVYGFVRRELVRQLHPGMRAPVRLGRSTLSEPMVSRMVGSVSLSLALLVVGALVLSEVDPALDSSTAIIDAVSIAVTSVANAGPAFVDGSTLDWPSDLGVVGRLTASVLMLVGRVEITPVLVALGLVAERASVRLPRRRRTRELLR